MPEITWTNCADAMPPIVLNGVILRRIKIPKAIGIYTPASLYTIMTIYLCEWTPYTPEKWKELNK